LKKAFTMIELVLVIIIVGIISATIVPQIGKTSLDRCAQQVLHHIRYTQHLAMMDNKFDPNDQYWYRSRWQIQFQHSSGEWFYTIYTNKDGTGSNALQGDIAKNPLNSTQLLTGKQYAATKKITNEMNLYKKYNIKDINFSSSCTYSSSKRISFDYLGRPLYGNPTALDAKYNDNFGSTGVRLIQNKCTITLTDTDNNSRKIVIMPETGYSYIED